MKLEIMPRAGINKSETKKLRREGFIPAVLYVKNKEGETIAVKGSTFKTHLREIKSGHLPTTIFTIVDSQGQERRVLVKEIQYNVTTYEPVHLDFEMLEDDVRINVKVPIECVGMDVCPGIKLGGVLRQVIRHARVNCLSKHLPLSFVLDVKDLSMKQSKRLGDLNVSENVRLIGDLKEVVAVIVKR
jgi:large subunit ribosomal protein L25